MKKLAPLNVKDSLNKFRDEMDDFFERLLPQRRHSRDMQESWLFHSFDLNGPAIDMVETDKDIRITAELPGLSQDDFKVELRGNRLVISGEKRYNNETKDENLVYSECRYGSFSRVFDLPTEVNIDKVKAKYKDGELRLTLPKIKESVSRKVKIDVN